MPDHEHLPFDDLPAPAARAGERAGSTVEAHEAKGRRRRPDTIWRRNPRDQGLIGVTDAMAYFGARGWGVCVPLIDNQPYDLVVDDGRALRKVQVKTTTYRSSYGVFVVSLATRGGNQSFHTSKDFDATACDLLYALTDDGSRYLIPTAAVTSKTTISLGQRMECYRIGAPERS